MPKGRCVSIRLALLGTLLSIALLAGLSTAGPARATTTFVVRNTNDSGPDSLRAAILAANASSDLNTIKFNIPGTIPYEIVPVAPLPPITQPVVINGRSQPGFTGSPLIWIDHGANNPVGIGLDIRSGSSTVLSVSVTRFATGIRLSDRDGNTIKGCWIGLDVGGVAAANVTGIAIQSASAGNVVGGKNASDRNVISGNTKTGLLVDGAGSNGNTVQGNYLGTDPAGTAAAPNGEAIVVDRGARTNTIGGTTASAGNLISGNYPGNAVALRDTGTSGNLVEGNVLGVDAAGTSGLRNQTGIQIAAGASGNTIGGTAAGSGNTIMFSWGNGVEITGQATTATVVAGNYIGGKSAGFPVGYGILGNLNGVAVTSGAHANTIGGTAPAAKNVIVENRADGILLDGAATTGILVEGNDIGANDRHGITVSGGARANAIGGTVAGARNLIWGNLAGIDLSGTGTKGNPVEGNFIGTDSAGMTARGNGSGVKIEDGASDNTIGGTNAAARNLISGNGIGVWITGANANVVEGNYVGTDVAGTGHLANVVAGVSVWGSASGNTIGGTAASARNVISGNLPGEGVDFSGSGPGNVLEGNYIGVDETGAVELFNSYGVSVAGANKVTIGGTAPGAGNVISASANVGVGIYGGTTGVVVAGNLIGTDASGTVPLGNAGGGVYATGSTSTGVIGGTVKGAANTIAFNGYGVYLNFDGGSPGVSILGNSIFSNYQTQISSPGPKPTIDSVTTAGSTTTIDLGLAGVASTAYRIEIFASPLCEFGQPPGAGKTFLGAKSVTTNASGNASLSIAVAAVAPGRILTATATNLKSGQTSSFSQCTTAP